MVPSEGDIGHERGGRWSCRPLGAGLFMAAQNNELEDVRKQIESGIDPNSSMNDGLTPLFMAVANNRMEMAKLLLDKGANVVRTDRRTGRTTRDGVIIIGRVYFLLFLFFFLTRAASAKAQGERV